MEVFNSTGRRKTSVARVYVTEGKGDIKINNRTMTAYFPSEILRTILQQPLLKVEAIGNFDIEAKVSGGGIKGQAEAIRLGIARALCKIDGSYKTFLKSDKLLTRDSRMVERKKPGRRKARRAFQFSKR